MALKELLVHLNQAEEVEVRLRLAMDLATRHASHLTALFVDEWNDVQMTARATAEMGLAAAGDLDSLDQSVNAEIQKTAARLRNEIDSARAERGLETEWRHIKGLSETAVKRFSFYADLCILGHEGLSEHGAADSAFCESILVALGTPILFVPRATSVTTLGRRIVVAWDSSRAAARTLNDALPLIGKSDRTTILNVDCGKHEQSTAMLKRLTERLKRHCASADFAQLEAQPEAIADVLQVKALELGADLIVSGAFGHSRLKEHIFGGVTRDLLERTRLPLLMSH